VVGLPFNKDGKEQEMTFIAKSFGRKLTNRYKLETVFIDEYLSSSIVLFSTTPMPFAVCVRLLAIATPVRFVPTSKPR
jgi:hypothetical protein